MPVKSKAIEYETVVVGGAFLVKNMLTRLGVAAAIDQALPFQPEIQATYGQLAQVIITNRLTFQPAPLYHLSAWSAQHGMDKVFGLQADWLDDDRLGALLDALADRPVTVWTTILKNVVHRFPLDLEWLHSDTTSVYFEGAYEDENGQPKRTGKPVPLLVEGYNKDGQRHKVQLVLSLITHGRVPLWDRPWDGNQTDEGVYVADMNALRQAVLGAGNAVLIGDRKLCTVENQLALGQQHQAFLAAHPWTDTKSIWLETYAQLQDGRLTWTPVDYVSRHNARKTPEKRPRYQVCEIARTLTDSQTQHAYPVRWIFSHSSDKAEQDAHHRTKALQAGEQALQRIARLVGKYDYTDRQTIEMRIEQALHKAQAERYWRYTLTGTESAQDWKMSWQKEQEVLDTEARFDGIALLCTNVPTTRLPAGTAMIKYKEQVNVEQTIDFIKSPVPIRPMGLHSPKRLVGLTLLIMIAVLVAALLEHQIRRWIAKTGQTLKGLMPEKRDNRYPTAKALLRAFADYALVLVRRKGRRTEMHYPELRPIQQQIWKIMGFAALG